MAEVGLLAFARIALPGGRAAHPPYGTGFSKRQFRQPQLRASRGLKRQEDWTFRQAEVRQREDGELRQALELASVPLSPRCTASSIVWTNARWPARWTRPYAGCPA